MILVNQRTGAYIPEKVEKGGGHMKFLIRGKRAFTKRTCQFKTKQCQKLCVKKWIAINRKKQVKY